MKVLWAHLAILLCLTISSIKCLNNYTGPNLMERITEDRMFLDKYSKGKYLKATPSLIPELANNTSQCLNPWKNILGYFSDYEQALIVLSARNNTDTNRCIDCKLYSHNLPVAFDTQIELLAKLITDNQVDKRDALACLLNFNPMGYEASLKSSLIELVMSYLYTHGEKSKCYVEYLNEVGQILFQRRRFLCATNADIKAMAIFDANNQITGFKWTQEEAKNMTESFIRLTQCINKERYSLPQTFMNSIATMIISPTCRNPNNNITNTQPVGNAPFSATPSDANPPVYNGPRNATNTTSGRGLRFLETVTNVTQPQPINNTHTTANTTTANITALETPRNNTAATSTTTHNATTTNATNIVPPAAPTAAHTAAPTATTTNNTNANRTAANPLMRPAENNTNTANTTTTTGPITVSPMMPVNVTNPGPTNAAAANVTVNATAANATHIVSATSNGTSSNANEVISTGSSSNMTSSIYQAMPNPIIMMNNNSKVPTMDMSLIMKNVTAKVYITSLLDYTRDDQAMYNSIKDNIQMLKLASGNMFANLAQMMNSKLLGTYEFNCMPGAFMMLFSNIKDGLKLLEDFEVNNQCTSNKNFTMILNQDSLMCENCNTSLQNTNITFIDQFRAPKDYFFSSSCINGKKVDFASWVDNIGMPYAYYQDSNFNMDTVCIKKAFTCSAKNASSEFCPIVQLQPKCKSEVESKCSKMGFFDMINKLSYYGSYDFVLPAQCDITKMQNETQLYSDCLSYMLNNFFIAQFNFNANTTAQMDDTMHRLIQPAPALRFLETATPVADTNRVVIIPNNQDPTLSDPGNLIRNQTFNEQITTVDGVKMNSNPNNIVGNYMMAITSDESSVSPNVGSSAPTTQPTTSLTTLPNTHISSIYINSSIFTLLLAFLIFN